MNGGFIQSLLKQVVRYIDTFVSIDILNHVNYSQPGMISVCKCHGSF